MTGLHQKGLPVVLCTFLLALLLFVWVFSRLKAPDAPDKLEEQAASKTYALGAVAIEGAPYFVKISEFDLVGRLFGSPIFEVQRVTLVPAGSGPPTDNSAFIEQLEDYFEEAGFYFSLDGKLPWSAQCIFSAQRPSCPDYFVGNKFMLEQFRALKVPDAGYTAVNAIRGHVSMGCLSFDNDDMVCGSVISRTSTARTSTRYVSRGGDAKGNVSNFVETEMIISRGQDHASVVQIRGSMPFAWQQRPAPNKVAPKFIIDSDMQRNRSIFKKHIEKLRELFPGYKTFMLNLVDQGAKKKEHLLGQTFTNIFNSYQDSKQHPDLAYTAFDYHCEAHQKDWVTNMLKRIKDFMEISFHAVVHGQPHQNQHTMVRTNCVDCLDRTNAAQSVIAKKEALPAMLSHLHITPNPQQEAELDQLLGSFWANNADAISRQYAGTKALKTDIARLGKRTRRGVLRDWRSSAKRYFNANWFDKARRASMLIVYGPESCPVEEQSAPRV